MIAGTIVHLIGCTVLGAASTLPALILATALIALGLLGIAQG